MVYVLPLNPISAPAGLPVAAPVQLTLYGVVPPLAVTNIDSLVPPAHVGLVPVADPETEAGAVIVIGVEDVQPSAAVI